MLKLFCEIGFFLQATSINLTSPEGIRSFVNRFLLKRFVELTFCEGTDL